MAVMTKKDDLQDVVNHSITQTLSRSLFTSQQTRDKSIADGYSCQCVEGDHYQHVMEQAGNTADTSRPTLWMWIRDRL